MTRALITQASSFPVSILPFHSLSLLSYRKQTRGRQIPTCANTSLPLPSRRAYQTNLTAVAHTHTILSPCHFQRILSGANLSFARLSPRSKSKTSSFLLLKTNQENKAKKTTGKAAAPKLETSRQTPWDPGPSGACFRIRTRGEENQCQIY